MDVDSIYMSQNTSNWFENITSFTIFSLNIIYCESYQQAYKFNLFQIQTLGIHHELNI